MAEAFLNAACGDQVNADSAGLEPGTLNPMVVRAMAEVGIDISGKTTKRVFDLYKAGKIYSYVITVCDEANAERCPVFPGLTQRLHWGFPDPSSFQGTDEERLAQTRKVRDAIEAKVNAWCREYCAPA